MKICFCWILCFLLFVSCREVSYTRSLAGEWLFALDPGDRGVAERWYARSLSDTVFLPGSLQAQGYGEDVGVGTRWTGQVVDRSWYEAPEYEKYRQPGNVKVPFWLNPDKHYVGVAWYQKVVDVPKAWEGRQVELELERTHWQTTLFCDGVEMGRHESLAVPFRYVFKGLKPGRHVLTLRVDNRVNIPVGVNAHSVSDHTQSNWNGVIGRVRLSAKPFLYIDDVQVFPSVTDKAVEVEVMLDGECGTKEAVLLLQVEKRNGERVGSPCRMVVRPGDGMKQKVVLPMDENEVLLWSEHAPHLYVVRAVVKSEGGQDEQCRVFGFRDFRVNGTRFEVNGSPVFLRGTLECCIFPLTGYPAMDAEYWVKIYEQCKAYGLNHVRFHSWCPPEVAFEVADRMGIYLQVECGGWATVGDGGYADQWFREEGDRILKEYGNHPSFCLMAYGNEPSGGRQVEYLSELVEYWKSKDLRRVYTSSGGWPYLENADYWSSPDPRIQRWGEGLRSVINAASPRTDFDFSRLISKRMPTVSHEIGQWCVYPNFKEISKYTGVLKAKNMEIFKETLAEHHLVDLADSFLYASGRLQALCYKADIEAALRTPGFAGFQLLDLHDFPGQGSALVGVLDAFWDEKGYVTGEEYRMFCNKTVPLARFPKMVWLNDELLDVPVELAHFGEKPVQAAHVDWQVCDEGGKVLARGGFVKDLPLANCIPAGRVRCSLAEVKEPSQLVVRVEVKETNSRNEWNIWVYPAEQEEIDSLPYVVSSLNERAMAELDRGGNVLLLLAPGSVLPEKGGDIRVGFSPIFWNMAWTNKQAPHTLGVFCDARHPALAGFPTKGYSDYQWWDLLSSCSAMVLDDFPADFRPVVHLIDDWFTNRKLGVLLEGKVGKGKLMVCSVDLVSDLERRPAARQFKRSVLQYMSSGCFQPSKFIDPVWVRGLYQR